MSTREIEEYIRDIYGVEVSPALVSKITDRIMPEVRCGCCRLRLSHLGEAKASPAQTGRAAR